MGYLITMLKKVFIGTAFLLFFVSLFLATDRFVHHKSIRFSLNKITNSHKSSPEWDIPALLPDEQKELDQILSQKFTYYNKGSQAYVFISEDKKHILKFLKLDKLRTNSWLANIPLSFNPYYRQKLIKQKKCHSTFAACVTAYKELKKETGLIYVHINSSRELNKKVTIFDKNGKRHNVDINQTSFYVQKRAQLIYSRISELMHKGDVEGAKNIISTVFSLIDYLGKNGIVDNDPILRKNFGLIDDIAVQIDIGKLRIDPQRQQNLEYKKEVCSITYSFKTWLKTNYSELSDHFEKCLNETSTSQASLQNNLSLPRATEIHPVDKNINESSNNSILLNSDTYLSPWAHSIACALPYRPHEHVQYNFQSYCSKSKRSLYLPPTDAMLDS